MDNARASVNLRSFGQREPIVEYKREGLKLFRELETNYLGQVSDIMKNLETDPSATNPSPTLPQGKGAGPLVSVVNVKKSDGSDFERNDKVVITKDGEEKEVKYKNLDSALIDGWSVKTEARKS
jgi:preprotein translocase subunit SecA